MLVSDCTSIPAICCTPWDSVAVAASLMQEQSLGAIVVMTDLTDRLLEGIVTDRDIACHLANDARCLSQLQVGDVMTRVPVTCREADDVHECVEFMRENQVRRLPVLNEHGRCVGIVGLRNLACHLNSAELGNLLNAILRPSAARRISAEPDRSIFYCGQLHEADQIALLSRSRQLKGLGVAA